jgi:hypothetical protein
VILNATIFKDKIVENKQFIKDLTKMECDLNDDMDVVINYNLQFNDFSETVKLLQKVNKLVEISKINNVQNIQEIRDAFYTINQIQEYISDILRAIDD